MIMPHKALLFNCNLSFAISIHASLHIIKYFDQKSIRSKLFLNS